MPYLPIYRPILFYKIRTALLYQVYHLKVENRNKVNIYWNKGPQSHFIKNFHIFSLQLRLIASCPHK